MTVRSVHMSTISVRFKAATSRGFTHRLEFEITCKYIYLAPQINIDSIIPIGSPREINS